MNFKDFVPLTDKKLTKDGFLVCSPKVARIGIQDYSSEELGMGPGKVMKIYRPEEEVFAQEAMFSFAHKPVTNDHPPVMVDSKNWKEYSVGQTGGEVLRDGDFVRVPMVLMDQDTIDEVEKGKKELSMGYSADLDMTPGEYNGQKYDGAQRNIRGNHLAICDTARGGHELKIGDSEVSKMKKMQLGGITIEVTDTAEEVINKEMKDAGMTIEELEKEVAALKAAVAELNAKLESATTDNKNKEAELATVKKEMDAKELTPDKIDELVEERMDTKDKAAKIVPNISMDKKKIMEIKREVVQAKLGDSAKSWNDGQINASFNTLASFVKDEEKPNEYRSNQTFTLDTGRKGNKSDEAYDKMKDSLSNAWKTVGVK